MYMRLRKVKFPCTVCSYESGDGTIQCSGCGEWTHGTCLGKDEEYLQQFVQCDFYCPICATEKGDFVWLKCIKRYVSYVAVTKLKSIGASRNNLSVIIPIKLQSS